MKASGLDPSRLENVKHLDGGSIRAACPACRAGGSDKSGDHLLITVDGKFGCAANPNDREHRKAIFKLAASPDFKIESRNGRGGRIAATYDYQDAKGRLLFQVCRYLPKTFKQRRPDGNGEWIWNMDGVQRVLFRLPELIRDKARGLPIFICEGEKDVLEMARYGFSATCNPGGAGKWQDSYTETLQGAVCIIVPDKDKAGNEHAALVASKLHGVAKSVRVIKLPGDNVKDAADFFAAGGDAGQIVALVDSTSEWKPQAETGRLPVIIDAATFIAEPIEPPAELVAGILHKGSKLVFGGSSKSFKTWTLLDLALSVSAGVEWLGFETVQGKVLFVNFEIQPHAWQHRIAAVTRTKGIDLKPGQILLWNLRGHAADFHLLIPQIIERARAENFDLIVLDPIYKLYGSADENKATDVAALLNEVERLTVETSAAVAYGSHFAKGNASAKEAIDRISGSGVFARDPDSLLIFTKHEAEDAFVVEPILRNFPPVAPFCARWQFPVMQRADELDPARLKQAPGRKRQHDPGKLLAAIAKTTAKKAISISGWAAAAGVKRQTLTDYLTEMRAKGWIATAGEGNTAKQYITKKGKEFLKEQT